MTRPLPNAAGARQQDLRRNLAKHAWDGAWYRRAWFDDGSLLGTWSNAECSIDSIAQSWSVLSGAGDIARSRMAMDALDKRLVRRDSGLIQLLDPPFDKSALNPGYIKGYVPGRPRERRPVHACGGMGGDGICRARRRSPRLGARRTHQSAEPFADGRCGRRLQGRALRHRGRRLRGPAAHRSRRMDLVHGRGRLVLPPDRGVPAGIAAAWRHAAHRPVHAGRLGRHSPCATASARRTIASGSCASVPPRGPTGSARSWTASTSAMPPFPWSTTNATMSSRSGFPPPLKPGRNWDTSHSCGFSHGRLRDSALDLANCTHCASRGPFNIPGFGVAGRCIADGAVAASLAHGYDGAPRNCGAAHGDGCRARRASALPPDSRSRSAPSRSWRSPPTRSRSAATR